MKKGQCIYLWRANGSTEFGNGVKYGASQLLYMLESAPDLDVAFKDPQDRDAARTFMDLLDQANSVANE